MNLWFLYRLRAGKKTLPNLCSSKIICIASLVKGNSMETKEYELYKKLAALEMENGNLKSQMEKLSKDVNTNQVTEVYEAAKKRMYTWIAALSVVFTLFGFVSINSIISEIEEKILQVGEDKIVEKIASRFAEKYEDIISDSITARLLPKIEGKLETITNDLKESTAFLVKTEVERNVREELVSTLKNVAQKKASSNQSVEPNYLLEAVEKNYEQNDYWVIAASSVRRKDVENELERMQRKVGPAFNKLFPDAEVTQPYAGTNHYPLVLGTGLPYSQAMALKNKAIEVGFRADTFLWKVRY
jgi:cell division protein FtsB